MKREQPLGTAPTMTEIRLELLKLIHVHSKDEQTLIDRAAKLEDYVLNGVVHPDS